MGVADLTAEQRVDRWLVQIADEIRSGECPDGILEHIEKHVTQEMTADIQAGKLESWVASMENLISILRLVYRVDISPEMQLRRLQEQVLKFPDRRTAEPAYRRQNPLDPKASAPEQETCSFCAEKITGWSSFSVHGTMHDVQTCDGCDDKYDGKWLDRSPDRVEQPPIPQYRRNFIKVKQSQVQMGDLVYIDNYQDGKFPKASPVIAGPFRKVVGNGSGRCFEATNNRTTAYYPDTLLRPKPLTEWRMSQRSLLHWERHYVELLLAKQQSVDHGGVRFYRDDVSVRYMILGTRASGSVFAASESIVISEVLQWTPRLKLSPEYSMDQRYCKTTIADLSVVAAAAWASWQAFRSS